MILVGERIYAILANWTQSQSNYDFFTRKKIIEISLPYMERSVAIAC
jgi:hypothetical protein